jgi:hypothetical protein
VSGIFVIFVCFPPFFFRMQSCRLMRLVLATSLQRAGKQYRRRWLITTALAERGKGEMSMDWDEAFAQTAPSLLLNAVMARKETGGTSAQTVWLLLMIALLAQ